MRIADVIAEFLRYRYESGQLVQANFAVAIGLHKTTVNAVIRGDKSFPMYYVDECAAFFGMDVPEFIAHARAEVKRVGRWTVAALSPEEEQRLRVLRMRAGLPHNDEG